MRRSVARRKEIRWINHRLAELRTYLRIAPKSGVLIRSPSTKVIRKQFLRYLKKKMRRLK